MSRQGSDSIAAIHICSTVAPTLDAKSKPQDTSKTRNYANNGTPYHLHSTDVRNSRAIDFPAIAQAESTKEAQSAFDAFGALLEIKENGHFVSKT